MSVIEYARDILCHATGLEAKKEDVLPKRML